MDTPAVLSFRVYGAPATKGSMKPVRNKHSGRIRLIEDHKTSKPFREAIKSAALDAMQATAGTPAPFHMLTGPVEVAVIFALPKPKSAPKRRRTWPISQRSGDVDKLLRNLFDALTDVGVIGDDAQVIRVTAEKAYVGESSSDLPVPGADVVVRPLAQLLEAS